MATIHEPTEENLRLLAGVLRSGGLVAIPTETVYGLAANGLDALACEGIFKAKDRPAYDPLILHLLDESWIERVAVRSEAVDLLARAFWPGALTLVLPKLPEVPDLVTAGLDSVAVRVPAHPVMRRLLEMADLPLAAPSANPFGYVSPTTAEHVEAGLGRRIDHILDGGPCTIGVESSIVDLRDPARPALLRPGGVTREALTEVLGVELHVEMAAGQAAEVRGAAEAPQAAPGTLPQHYSPRARVELHERLSVDDLASAETDEAFVFLRRPSGGPFPAGCRWLSEDGDLTEAAARLFAVLRELDERRYRVIHVEQAPQHGLGLAVNDRLQRAAHKTQGSKR